MFKVNDNYLKLPGSYLFSTIGKKVSAYSAAHPDKKIIRLGIGDVTQPLAPAIIDALHGAVDEMGKAETFHGYAPDLGYEFLRNAIAENDYKARGCDIAPDEIFVSDGAKCDCGNIQEIFSLDNKIAVCDPVYPVYVDSNVMAGRTGTYDPKSETWSDVIYMPCLAENGFAPELPKETPDLIYLCFPNNPTGATITKVQLQEWVDYANKVGAVILYDAAYEAYISEPDVPHSIYECEGARTCAIEFRSFSKNAGFTGVLFEQPASYYSENASKILASVDRLPELQPLFMALADRKAEEHARDIPEEALYSGGFPSNSDARKMANFRALPPEEMADAFDRLEFDREDLAELTLYFMGRNYPEYALTPETERLWRLHKYNKLVKGLGDSRTFTQFYEELEEARAGADEHGLEILEDVEGYVENLRSEYEA